MKYKKNYGKKSYRRFKKRRRSTKKLKRVIRSVARDMLEMKSGYATYAQGMRQGIVYARNINHFLAQGTQANQMTGEQYWLKNIHWRGRFATNYSAVAPAESSPNTPTAFRLLVVRTKKQLTAGVSEIAAADVFRSEGTLTDITRMHVDFHKVDLLYDKTIIVNPGTSDTSNYTIHQLDKVLRINKKCVAESENSGWLKSKNYFFIFAAKNLYLPYDSPGTIGWLDIDYTLNIKDM